MGRILGIAPGQWRNNVRRAERRLRGIGAIDFVRFRPEGASRGDGEPAWNLYNACCDIAAKSWQGRLDENTTLTSERVSEFLRDVHAIAAPGLEWSISICSMSAENQRRSRTTTGMTAASKGFAWL